VIYVEDEKKTARRPNAEAHDINSNEKRATAQFAKRNLEIMESHSTKAAGN
jgi:hypothetical protein